MEYWEDQDTSVTQTAIPWCNTHDGAAINAGTSNPNPAGSICLWALTLGKKKDRAECVVSLGGPDHKWWKDRQVGPDGVT